MNDFKKDSPSEGMTEEILGSPVLDMRMPDLPDELKVKIIKGSIESFDINLSSDGRHDFNQHQWYCYARISGVPNLINLRLVSKMFNAETIKEVESKFSGRVKLIRSNEGLLYSPAHAAAISHLYPLVREVIIDQRCISGTNGLSQVLNSTATPNLRRITLELGQNSCPRSQPHDVQPIAGRQLTESEEVERDRIIRDCVPEIQRQAFASRGIELKLDILISCGGFEQSRCVFSVKFDSNSDSAFELLVHECWIPLWVSSLLSD